MAYTELPSTAQFASITILGFTSGSVVFVAAGGLLAQDNANFMWDNVNKRLCAAQYCIGSTLSPMAMNLTRVLASAAGATTEIGTFTLASSGAYNIRVSVEINESGYSEGAQYLIPVGFGTTSSVYWQCQPVAQNAYNNNLGHALDVNSAGSFVSLRLRSLGNTGGTAYIRLEYVGGPNQLFTPSSATGSASNPPEVFQVLEFIGPNEDGAAVNSKRIYGMTRAGTIGTSFPLFCDFRLGRYATSGSAHAKTKYEIFLNDTTFITTVQRVVAFQANRRMALGGNVETALAVAHITATEATDLVALNRGAASQTEDLEQWQNSSATVLARVTKDGVFVFNENGLDADCRIEGDTDVNLFYTDASTDRIGIGTATPGSKLDVAGSFQCDSVTNDTGLASGVYTPTLTIVANLDAVTAYQCQYLRVGNSITVSGKIDIDPTSAGTSTQLGISLPVASNFGAEEDAGGGAVSPVTAEGFAIRADAANNRAELIGICGASASDHSIYFHFSYRVI